MNLVIEREALYSQGERGRKLVDPEVNEALDTLSE